MNFATLNYILNLALTKLMRKNMSVKNKMEQVTVKEDSLIELEDLYIIFLVPNSIFLGFINLQYFRNMN